MQRNVFTMHDTAGRTARIHSPTKGNISRAIPYPTANPPNSIHKLNTTE